MGIGIQLRGTLPKLSPANVAQLLEDASVEVFGSPLNPSLHQTTGTNFVLFAYPAAAPIEIELTKSTRLRKATITVTANTGTAGAGYHEAVVRFLDALTATGVVWDADTDEFSDETGYFRSRDPKLLSIEVGKYLMAMMKMMDDSLSERETAAGPLLMWMPLSTYFSGRSGDDVMLPMGPKSREWIRSAAADPDLALSLHAWPEPGLGALALRNAALCQMWSDVPWCEAVDESTAELYTQILDLLSEAHKLDPQLDMPWAAWKEVAELAGEAHALPPAVAARAVPAPRRPIGYRRDPITHALPAGLRITLPGSMTFIANPDDENVLLAVGDLGNVRISVLSAKVPLTPAELEEMFGSPPDADEGMIELRKARSWQSDSLRGVSYRWTDTRPDDDDEPGAAVMTSAHINRNTVVAFITFVSGIASPIDWVDAALDSLEIVDADDD